MVSKSGPSDLFFQITSNITFLELVEVTLQLFEIISNVGPDINILRRRVVAYFLQSFRQFDLGLYLSPQLLHPPEVLHHLSPDDLYDGGGEGQAQEDVDSTDHHVQTFVCNIQ